MEKKQECEHIFIKEKAKLHFISGRELLYKKEKTQTDEQLKSHLIFTAFNNFTFGCFCSPLVSTHHVNRSPYRHKRKHDQHLTHTNTSRKEEKCLLSAVRLTSLSDFLRCSFPYPAVGTCHHEGPSIQVYIQVSWNKMLCCCFIATPGTSKEECVSTLHCHPYFYMH